MSAFGWHAECVCARLCLCLCVCVILEMPTVGEFLEEEEVSGDLKARDEDKCYFCVSRQKDFCVCVCVCVYFGGNQSGTECRAETPQAPYFKLYFIQNIVF